MAYTLYALIFPNGKRYIGLTAGTALDRWDDHLKSADKRATYPVYQAIRKYGPENIQVRTLAVGSKDYIQDLEIRAIAAFQTRDRNCGYNLAVGGEVSPMRSVEIAARFSAELKRRFREDPACAERLLKSAARLQSKECRDKANAAIRTAEVSAAKSLKLTGFKHSEATRAHMKVAQNRPEQRLKIGIASRRAWADPEYRVKQSASRKGRIITSEQRAKISAALMGHPGHGKGQKRDPAIVAKFSAARMGHEVSAETRAKIAAAHRGRKASPETIAKLSLAARNRNRGIPKSEECKRKISESLRGRVQSPETKEKRRQSMMLFFLRKKQEKEFALRSLK